MCLFYGIQNGHQACHFGFIVEVFIYQQISQLFNVLSQVRYTGIARLFLYPLQLGPSGLRVRFAQLEYGININFHLNAHSAS